MKVRGLFAIVAIAGASASAMAGINDFNSFNMVYRNFNDYPNSTITPTINGNSGVRIVENMGPVNADNPQKFANRHFANFSSDGGATRLELKNNESFKVSYKMRLSSNIDNDGSGLLWNPQPEGGIFFGNKREVSGSPGTYFYDEGGIFVVGNGTVFAGGANQNFSLIGDHNNGTDAFQKGNILQMSYTYYAPNGGTASYTIQFDNLTTGFSKTVHNTFDVAGGPDANGFNDGSWVAFRFQNTRNPLVDGGTINDTEYYDVSVVPATGTASLLALSGLVAARRRRA